MRHKDARANEMKEIKNLHKNIYLFIFIITSICWECYYERSTSVCPCFSKSTHSWNLLVWYLK